MDKRRDNPVFKKRSEEIFADSHSWWSRLNRKNVILISVISLLVLGSASFLIFNGGPPDDETDGGSLEIIFNETTCVQLNEMNFINVVARNNLNKTFKLENISVFSIDGINVKNLLSGSLASGQKKLILSYDCSLSDIGFCEGGSHFIEFGLINSTMEVQVNCMSIGAGGFCGDGFLDDGEECDDGNNINGDGCSSVCEDEEDTEENTTQRFPLTEFLSSSYYNEGLATSLSKDRNYLYRSDGSMLQKIDLNLMRASSPPDIDDMIISEMKIYSSAMDIEEIGDFVYVCGGDFGIHKTSKELTENPELMDKHSRDIWCTSLAYANIDNKDILLALWSGLGDTELKIYDTQDDSVLASILINEQTGLSNEGIGWDVEEDSGFAYIAMGTSGIVRVDLNEAINQNSPNPLQGPLAVTNQNYDRETQKLLSVKDLSIRNGFLYAAASAQGLIEIDLSQTWSDSMQTTTYFHENQEINQYPSKVASLTDAVTSTIIVIVKTDNTPNPSEWGPHVMYGGYIWNSFDPSANVNELDNQNNDYTTSNENNGVTIFEKRQGDPNLNKIITEEISLGPREKIRTFTAQQVGNEYFAYGNLPAIFNFYRDTDNRIKLRDLTDGKEFVQGRGGYSDGRESLIEPGKIVTSSDGGFHGFQKLEGSPLKFFPIENTFDAEHKLGLWNEITWVTQGNKEFLIAGGAGEHWPLREISWSNGVPSVDFWQIPVNLGESTDNYGYDPRSYAHAGLDNSTGLVALIRSGAKEGLILTTKNSIYDSAKEGPSNVIPPILSILDLHEEAPQASGIGEEFLYAFHPKFFRDKDQKRMLAVPAGYYVDVNSANYQHPKLVFYEIPEPFDETEIKNKVIIGPESPSMYIDLEIFEFDQKQMAVVVGGNGDVYLHNLEKLSEVIDGQASPSEIGAIDTWKMRNQPLDKRKTLISDLRIREETVNDETVTRVYVAANNDGVYILELRKNGNNYHLEEIERLNTIYQAVSLSIEEIDGEEVLLVYDHGGGIVAFGEEE